MYNYYKILDVERTASQDEIKRAYRSKAKLLHPDVNGSAKAGEVFAVVSEAYEVLSNENKRYLHDIKLNYADTTKADAERKKQYYGSSVKNDSYTNNFHYDWESFSKGTFKEKTDIDYYKKAPIFYNALFVIGMLLGFIIIIVTITGTIRHYWPLPFGALVVIGVILVREGWKGIIKLRK